MHPIFAKFQSVEAELTRLPSSVPDHARAAARGHLDMARSRLAEFLADDPAPEAIAADDDAERVQQAAEQSDADRGGYLPVQRAMGR